MKNPFPPNADSRLGKNVATVALAIGCVYSSAASAQISTASAGTISQQVGTAPAKSTASTEQSGNAPTTGVASSNASRPLVVFVDHKAIETTTTANDIDGALSNARIRLGQNDIVLPSRHGALPADGILHVQRVVTWTQNICSHIAPKIENTSSATMLKHTTHVRQNGKQGLLQTTIRYMSIDGQRAQSKVVAKHVLIAATPRIVAHGTANSKAEIAERLNALTESTLARTDTIAHAAMAMIATAYTAFCDGCSGTGRGATGMLVHHGVVAVDPRVIPLGSHLYIPGYGRAIAGDTGGAIVGHRIDLAFNSYGDAIRFGRRPVKVYVLNR